MSPLIAASLPALVLIAGLAGCATQHSARSVAVDEPDYETLAAIHNTRVGRLTSVRATGQATFAWTQEDEVRTGDCRVELMLRPPAETAVSLTQLGERICWIGSNEQAQWQFELFEEPRVVTVMPTDRSLPLLSFILASEEVRGRVSTDAIARPAALVDLMGLFVLPEYAPGSAPPVAYDKQTDAWRLRLEDHQPPIEVLFDRRSWLPERVTLLVADGNGPSLALGRYASIEVDGVPPGLFPSFPTSIVAGDLERAGFELRLNTPSGRAARVQDRFFDFDELSTFLRPEIVRGTPPPPSS
jgi:hypothetical protein